PLIHVETYALFRIILIHHRFVVTNELVHPQRLGEGRHPLGLREFNGCAFGFPFTGRQGIEMEADSIKLQRPVSFDTGRQMLSPFGIFRVATSGNKVGSIVVWWLQEGGVVLVQVRVVRWTYVAAATPGLVTDCEIV